MKIIIAGAGAVGTHLAKLLSREKQDIILMDDNEERLSTLSSNFDLMTVTASPTSIQGLKEVGARDADLFIAVTPDESRNMTACMLATNLGAKKTVASISAFSRILVPISISDPPQNSHHWRAQLIRMEDTISLAASISGQINESTPSFLKKSLFLGRRYS